MASASRVDELRRRLRQIVAWTLSTWEQAPDAAAAPAKVRVAMWRLAAQVDGPDTALLSASERVVRASMPSVALARPWTTELLRIDIIGLNSLTRQLRRSPVAIEVLQICQDLRESPSVDDVMSEFHGTRLLAALAVVEDATCAIEGYRALPPFPHVDEAYLAKYGLLQALQLGFDAAEGVARVFGANLRADQMPGGKVVKITRTVVAGHPLGGSMRGDAWEHFHDRGSVHDKSVMRIMSFHSHDTERWVGQTQLTAQLMDDGLRAIRDLLRRCLEISAANPPSRPTASTDE